MDGQEQQVKDYQLCRLQDGRIVLDEGGGLLLDTLVVDNKMFSGFATGGATLFTVTSLDGDEMVFD
ncbi:MAG: hypothetical protein AAF742_00480, partial [Pseudomonadota bacterium]